MARRWVIASIILMKCLWRSLFITSISIRIIKSLRWSFTASASALHEGKQALPQWDWSDARGEAFSACEPPSEQSSSLPDHPPSPGISWLPQPFKLQNRLFIIWTKDRFSSYLNLTALDSSLFFRAHIFLLNNNDFQLSCLLLYSLKVSPVQSPCAYIWGRPHNFLPQSHPGSRISPSPPSSPPHQGFLCLRSVFTNFPLPLLLCCPSHQPIIHMEAFWNTM